MLTRLVFACQNLDVDISLTVTQCHTHQKVKDTPKRRREANHAKAMTKAAICEEVKLESRDDTPVSLDMGLSTMDEGAEHHLHSLPALDSMP